MGGPIINPDQSFVAPADGFVKGLTIGLKTAMNGGQMFIYVMINDSPASYHTIYYGSNVSYMISEPEWITLAAGDRVTCYIGTDSGYSAELPIQQVQVDLLMEFPWLPEAYVPPIV